MTAGCSRMMTRSGPARTRSLTSMPTSGLIPAPSRGWRIRMLRKHEDQEARNMLLGELPRYGKQHPRVHHEQYAHDRIPRSAGIWCASSLTPLKYSTTLFAGDVHKINHGIESIGKKYEIDSDQPVRYVCADQRMPGTH